MPKVASIRIWRMGSAFDTKRPVGPRGIGIEPRTAWKSDLPNHDFRTCDLSGWTINRGSAFSDRVITRRKIFWKKVYFNPSYSIPGNCHLWGYNAWGGDAATGTMQTDSFILGGNGHINFLIAGGDDIERVYIALVRTHDNEVLFKATGVDYEEYRREFWDASAYIGERVYIKVVDDSSEDFGHINLDDIHVPIRREARE